MDALTLIRQAEAAGLTLEAQGDKMIVRGPKSAEPIVRRLAEHKPAILQALEPNWADDAAKVIAQFTDLRFRSDLTTFYDKAVAALEHKGSLNLEDAQMQAFGLLLYEILRRGIDVKAALATTGSSP